MNVRFIIGLALVIIFGLDLLVFFINALLHLPTGLTEWICYPFWPIIQDGFGMGIGMIIRFIEVVGIIVGVVLIV